MLLNKFIKSNDIIRIIGKYLLLPMEYVKYLKKINNKNLRDRTYMIRHYLNYQPQFTYFYKYRYGMWFVERSTIYNS
jgi:hypothetical protein